MFTCHGIGTGKLAAYDRNAKPVFIRCFIYFQKFSDLTGAGFNLICCTVIHRNCTNAKCFDDIIEDFIDRSLQSIRITCRKITISRYRCSTLIITCTSVARIINYIIQVVRFTTICIDTIQCCICCIFYLKGFILSSGIAILGIQECAISCA